jgi:acyl-coenzyme A synthetase/AMP-(fatty) acid ligase
MRVTRICCAAIHLHQLCALGKAQALMPELRVLDVVGSEVPESLRRAVREKVSKNLYVTYGATETGALTVAPPEADIPGR